MSGYRLKLKLAGHVIVSDSYLHEGVLCFDHHAAGQRALFVRTKRSRMRKYTCEVYLSTLPVGYSGSLSTVNETNCNKKNQAI